MKGKNYSISMPKKKITFDFTRPRKTLTFLNDEFKNLRISHRPNIKIPIFINTTQKCDGRRNVWREFWINLTPVLNSRIGNKSACKTYTYENTYAF